MDDRVTASRTRKTPFLAPDFVRAMLAGHSALGLAFAALIYIVCLSGTVSVFLHELHRWEQPNAPRLAETPSPDVVAAVVSNGYDQAKMDNAAHDLFVMGPSHRTPWLTVSYHDHETGVSGNWLADTNGNLVTRIETPWTQFVADLHMHLHLPRTWGLFLVGLTGVALLSSLISGLLSHPRLFKDAFALRWGGSKRLQEADLHNRLGVWGLPFHVVVSLTGALLGLSTLIVGVLAMAAYDGDSEKAFAAILGPQPSADETAAPLPDIAALIRKVQSEHPDAAFVSINVGHIGHAGQIVSLGLKRPGHLPFSEAYHFDGNGNARGVTGMEDGSVGQQILGVLQPLHFGWFGGLPVKLAYGILGLAITIVTHTGVTIWLARRRDKGRPVPRWERIWAAVGWGQPFAFGIAAVAAFAGGGAGHILATYGGGCLVALLLATVTRSGAQTTRVLRIFSGLALLSVVAMHVRTWGVSPEDAMATAVNVSIAVIAACLLLPTLRRAH